MTDGPVFKLHKDEEIATSDFAVERRDALIDRWFSSTFAGTRLTPPADAWQDLVSAKENLKQLLSHSA